MHRLLSVLAASLLFLPAEAAAQDLEVMNGVLRMWASFEPALESGDLEALGDLFTADAVVMEPAGDLTGRARIEEHYGELIEVGRLDVRQRTTTEIFAHGDAAYEFGTIAQSYSTTDGSPGWTSDGRYAAVLRMGSDGVWRIHRWMVEAAP